MYWPNEPAHLYPDFTQAGGRAAFETMVSNGMVSDLEIYSYRVERAQHPDTAVFEQVAFDAVRAFAPDVLFVQHLFGADLTENLWKKIRSELPQVTLAYHEGDPFDRTVKRIDKATIGILRHADIVLACGLGSLADILADHSAAPIRHMPHAFVKSRFALHDVRETAKTNDIVMIGNCGNRRRLKYLYLPGGRNRARFARKLSEAFDTRFALYGAGWSHLAAARGNLPFFEQEQAIQSARITANWDHFDTIDYYFSDRLPISLAAGVPHVTTHHVGYEHLFRDTPGLYACKTISEAVETCRWLLSRPDADLLEEGLAAKEWVFANMEANLVFMRGIEQALVVHRRRQSGQR